MIILTCTITLRDDLVVSRDSSTAGQHSTIDRILGARLRGLAAASLYERLDPQTAWTVFHSGKVRFADATPLVGNNAAQHVPFSWHRPKNAGDCIDLTLQDRARGVQYVQVRAGYHQDGKIHNVRRDRSLRTATSEATRSAANSQLFGYEAIMRGQRFMAEIEIDDHAAGQKAAIIDSLSGDRRMGRSKASEYGRVSIEIEETRRTIPISSETSGPRLIWCLSEVALANAESVAEALSGALVPERSFTRGRTITPYNGHHAAREPQFEVLEAGSVISLQNCDVPLGIGWIGSRRAMGFGRVLVCENLPTATVQQGRLDDQRLSVGHTSPSTLNWMRSVTPEQVRREAELLFGMLDRLRSDDRPGPSVSQWNSARGGCTGEPEWSDTLLGVIERATSGWPDPIDSQATQFYTAQGWKPYGKSQVETFRDALEVHLARQGDAQVFAEAIRYLANEMAARVSIS